MNWTKKPRQHQSKQNLSLFLDPDTLSTCVLLALKADMIYDKFLEKMLGFEYLLSMKESAVLY